MSIPTLVRGTLKTWDLYLALAAGAVALAVAVYLHQQKETAWAYVVAGGGAIAIFEGARRFGSRAKKRAWCDFEEDSFRVTDAQGERSYADDDVEAMAINDENIYSNGNFKGCRRRITFWATDDSPQRKRIEFDYVVPAGAPADTVAALITRLSDRLLAAANSTLGAGQAVTGDGWSLRGDLLSIAAGSLGPALECSLRDLSAAQVIERQVRIWRHDEELPCAKIPVEKSNAWVLARLLSERIVARPESDKPPASGLGRILFQRGPFPRASLAVKLLALAIAIGLTLVALADIPQSDKWWALGVGIPVTVVVLLIGFQLARNVFRCHEWGVYQAGLTSQKSLQYVDVATFSYSATRMYHNGAYTGTMTALKFEPARGANLPTIKYSTNIKGADDALEDLRDHISRVIAGRMQEQLVRDQAVAWTPAITFRAESLEHRPQGFIGRKEPITVPYEQIVGFDIREGNFSLWQQGGKKAAISEVTSAANFFPGFYLLSAMSQPGEE